jgi:RHS repeat-associated protein
LVSRFVYGTKPNVPEYIIKNGRTYRVFSDHLGSPRVIVDVETGIVVQRMDFHSFGEIIQDSNPGWQPFGFAAGLYDNETGLSRFGLRDYDPKTGRWLSQDPLRFGGGEANLYSYVSSDPNNHVDPTGMFVDTILDAVFVAKDVYNIGRKLWQGCSVSGGDLAALGLDVVGALTPGITGLGSAFKGAMAAEEAARKSKRYGEDAAALIDLAKEAARKTINREAAETLIEWAKEYNVEPALDHIDTDHWVGGPHIRIGQQNHIPVRVQ